MIKEFLDALTGRTDLNKKLKASDTGRGGGSSEGGVPSYVDVVRDLQSRGRIPETQQHLVARMTGIIERDRLADHGRSPNVNGPAEAMAKAILRDSGYDPNCIYQDVGTASRGGAGHLVPISRTGTPYTVTVVPGHRGHNADGKVYTPLNFVVTEGDEIPLPRDVFDPSVDRATWVGRTTVVAPEDFLKPASRGDLQSRADKIAGIADKAADEIIARSRDAAMNRLGQTLRDDRVSSGRAPRSFSPAEGVSISYNGEP